MRKRVSSEREKGQKKNTRSPENNRKCALLRAIIIKSIATTRFVNYVRRLLTKKIKKRERKRKKKLQTNSTFYKLDKKCPTKAAL